MKIISPITKVNETIPLIAAGADELYCGVLPAAWNKKYTNIGSINRRYYPYASLKSFSELKQIVVTAHDRGVKISLTVNEFYSQEQYDMLFEHIENAQSAGVDSIIVADTGLLWSLYRQGTLRCRVHVSTAANAFNSEAIVFFKKMGVSRIILPRQCTLEEFTIMAATARREEVELEVILMNTKCPQIDGLCTFHHGLYEKGYNRLVGGIFRFQRTAAGNFLSGIMSTRLRMMLQKRFIKNSLTCCLGYRVKPGDPCAVEAAAQIEKCFDHMHKTMNGCGVCALNMFQGAGITHFKISGREYSTEKKMKDVRFLARARSKIPAIPPEAVEKEMKKLYRRVYRSRCIPAQCYYPGERMRGEK